MFQLALDVWLTPAKPGVLYSAQLQKDVGSLEGLVGPGKENVSSQMLLLGFVFVWLIPLLFGQRSIIVLGLPTFLGFFVHFGHQFPVYWGAATVII